MNKRTKLGICLPTNEPETFYKLLLPTIENIKEVAEFSTFLIIFQAPYTSEQIQDIVGKIESYGFDVRWDYRKYEVKGKGLIPFNKIRNDSAELMPEADLYILIDDDVTFGKATEFEESFGSQLLYGIHYMLKHKRCGMIIFHHYKDTELPRGVIGPVNIINHYWNYKAMMFQNLKSDDCRLFPIDSLELMGSGDEKILSACRLAKGLYPAKLVNANLKHAENRRKASRTTKNAKTVVSGDEAYGWSAKEIILENGCKYIEDKYNHKMSVSRFNRGDLVPKELYLSQSGLDASNTVESTKFTIDYNKISSERVLEILRGN